MANKLKQANQAKQSNQNQVEINEKQINCADTANNHEKDINDDINNNEADQDNIVVEIELKKQNVELPKITDKTSNDNKKFIELNQNIKNRTKIDDEISLISNKHKLEDNEKDNSLLNKKRKNDSITTGQIEHDKINKKAKVEEKKDIKTNNQNNQSSDINSKNEPEDEKSWISKNLIVRIKDKSILDGIIIY